MLRLQNKNCIITGAAGGIGLETSILFAQNGANIVMADINKEQLDRAVATVVGFNKNVKVVAYVSSHSSLNGMGEWGLIRPRGGGKVCDVAKEDQIKAMVESVDEWGGLDVIFNNAGIMHAQVSPLHFPLTRSLSC